MADESHPSGWRLARLSELGEVNRGRSRHRPRYAEHLYGGPYPFIQTGDVKNSGGQITTYAQTYSEAGLAQSRLWPAGTMCITIAANIAETGILGFPACFPDSVVGFIADPAKCDVRFVEYMFRHMRQQIQHEASGSVQDNINLETLERLRFSLPPLPEQRAIAHILGTLDDKIELNRQVNQTLEQIAAALFKSWFVDFDPVRAKAEGRQPEGMDAETAALFPDRLVESEIGQIPDGWVVRELGDVCSELRRGLSPKYVDTGGIQVLNQRCIRNHRLDITKARRHDDTARPVEGRLLKVGDVLVNSTGVGTLGRVAQVLALEEPTIADSHVTVVRANLETVSTTYLGLLLVDREEEIEAMGEGSTGQTELARSRLSSLPIVTPPRQLLAEADKTLVPLLQRMQVAQEESGTLLALRDTLLPRLLSGQLRVPTDVLDVAAVPMQPQSEELLAQSHF